MTRCRHSWSDLVPVEGLSAAARLERLIAGLWRYHRCTLCGRVGYSGPRGIVLVSSDTTAIEDRAARLKGE